MYKYILSFIVLAFFSNMYSQDCSSFLKKKVTSYTDGYNYKSQSTFGTLKIGDTLEVRAIMYSDQLYKIFAKSEDENNYDVTIYKTQRKYKRIVDTVIEKKEKRKIYKEDSNGNKIPVKKNGNIATDSYGDTLFVVSDYVTTTVKDTIWKMERKESKVIIYDSKKNNIPVFENKNKRTQSIIIQITHPKNIKSISRAGECIAVLVGRKES